MRKAINIEWDLDDEELEDCSVMPPTELAIPEDIEDEDIDDYLSDSTGWCHYGYELIEE